MKKIAVGLFLALFIINVSLASTWLTFGQEANGRQLSISKGQVFRIQLPSNPTTGYDWHMDKINLRYFRFINSGFSHSTRKLVGAPGKKWFEFKALRAGNCNLRLLYYRSWEGKRKAAKEYTLSLNINK